MAQFPPPGRMLDIGGRRLHLQESGQGGPVVVLESGIAATSLNWRAIQKEISLFTRVVSYDRAGLGWSDAATTRRTTNRCVDDLRAPGQEGGAHERRLVERQRHRRQRRAGLRAQDQLAFPGRFDE